MAPLLEDAHEVLRRVAILALGSSVIFLIGCGGSEETPGAEQSTTANSMPAVQLTVSTPQDGSSVRRPSVEVRGTVVPNSADVLVDGRPAKVTNGLFRAKVKLGRGENLIAIEGTAAEAAASSLSIAITRNRSQAEIRAAVQRRKARAAQRRAAAEARKHADDYPADIRSNFLTTCTIDGNQSACECALERIERTVSLKQFILADQIATQNGYIPQKIQDAILECS